MSVSATRRVSGGASPSLRKSDRVYATGSQSNTSFVEAIDAAAGAEIKDKMVADKDNTNTPEYQNQEEKKQGSNLKASSSYVTNTIEALEASGVLEEVDNTPLSNPNRKIGVYDNNQYLINHEEKDRRTHEYTHKILDEDDVDEFA